MKFIFKLKLFCLLIAVSTLYGCSDFKGDQAAIFRAGIKSYNEGNYDEAVKSFKNAIDFEYKFVESYYYLGNAYVEKNQLDEAIVSYEKSIGLKRKYSKAYYGLARAYSLKGVAPKAIESLGKAIDLKRKWRDKAKDDQAFLSIRNTTEFQRLLKK